VGYQVDLDKAKLFLVPIAKGVEREAPLSKATGLVVKKIRNCSA
jgi:hypothetical protein